MYYNRMREEGLAIQKAYMQDAAEWRRARNPPSKTSTNLTPIKRLSLIGVAVLSLLFGR